MLKVGIIGATGYTGAELVRLACRHPRLELVALTSQTFSGQEMDRVYPSLHGFCSHICEDLSPEEVLSRAEVVFLALPHGHSVPIVEEALRRGVRVIDLGADLRFRDVRVYEEWYGLKHPNPELAAQAVYGLPEIHREEIASARVVANPGCYPTSVILALAPLIKAGYGELDSIVIDAKSGVSGAGRKTEIGYLFTECNESLHPYGVARHRHTPEIEQELSLMAGRKVTVSFTPHLVPITRGILSTIYVNLKAEVSEEELRKLYEEFYREARFVKLLPPGLWPHTRWVYGSNFCHINFTLDRRTGRLILASAIDNLTKGASGQALQNLNLMFGWPEDLGLNYPGLSP
ncbi:MAG: N-acetyl-gamma-glutamyl-phosphate reductase [Thermanaeromonas sp.]|uniref:N-acetyl-gamma-glutamyl-phosphate reductase n=1 Tax=Thermanaeromonas sp. TaxID=2003697 RepID=UPI0024380325|nr:N-acetyl-gamma-glutamyl-phosphate reductase [Thermanaeromonas sp.]MCG0277158.1 N-acetyl-gamma-glutamyl-phosphate reductase [Thermanaeromonas sp.]